VPRGARALPKSVTICCEPSSVWSKRGRAEDEDRVAVVELGELGAVLPARRAARLDVLEALAYE
jgi:hypothetical protein